MLGLCGISVDTPDALAGAWARALAADQPVVLEVKTDPDVAPRPPQVSLVQAKAFMSSPAHRGSSAGNVIADTARQIISAVRERLLAHTQPLTTYFHLSNLCPLFMLARAAPGGRCRRYQKDQMRKLGPLLNLPSAIGATFADRFQRARVQRKEAPHRLEELSRR